MRFEFLIGIVSTLSVSGVFVVANSMGDETHNHSKEVVRLEDISPPKQEKIEIAKETITYVST